MTAMIQQKCLRRAWLSLSQHVLLAVLLIVVGSARADAQSARDVERKPLFRDGVVLVGFKANTSREQQTRLIASIGAVEERKIGQDVHVLRVAPGQVMQVVGFLQRLPEIRFAEPDFRHSLNGTPNDPSFGRQWAFRNTGQTVGGIAGTAGADEAAWRAWDITTGDTSVVVAVVDTGIDYTHPDLAANVWSNPGDVNGCPAGTHGYNVLTNSCDPMDDDTAYNGHGTHVAGIIGAVTNNSTGVAGINWQTTLMGVKWVDASGTGFTSNLISALDWVIRAKQGGVNVRVVNDSQTWSGTAASTALSDEIDALGSNDILFVSAAGNTAQNNDTTPRYPCVYGRPNQICVAASDQSDQLWSSSNYGVQTVDLAAPGANIYSTLRNASYGSISGCSMSAAQISGAAALVLSMGYQSATNLKAILLNAVDLLPAFTSVTRTGGRLNICKAISGCPTSPPSNTALPVISGTPTVAHQLTASNGTWSGSPTSFAYQWQRCDSSGSNCSAISGATSNTYVLVGADANSTIRVAVTATNSAGSSTATSAQTSLVQGSSSGFGVVQKASAQGTNVGSLSVSFPAGTTAGNMIIAFVRASTTSQTVAVTDSGGNSYVEAVRQNQPTDGHQIRILYAVNSVTGANTVKASFSGTNAHPFLAIFEYSGLSATNSLDRTARAQGSGTAVSTGATAQTRAANELVFAAVGLPSSASASVTAGSGYTIEQQDTIVGGSRAATEDQLVNAIGSFAGTFTLSGSSRWSAAVATFSTTAIGGAPLTVTTSSLPSGTVGVAYSATLTATGGQTPYTWSLASGSALPAGLTLSSSGAISGTPTSSGATNFTVQVTDSSNPQQTATTALSITVITATTNPITLVQSSSVQGTAVTSVSQPFPSANTGGNLIIAFVRMSTTSQTVQVSDTAGNVYSDAIAQGQTADGHQIHIFYAKNINGGANTVTATFSSANNHPWLAIYEYSGLNTSAPLDQTAHAQGATSAPSSGLTAATTAADELVFAGLGLPATSGLTVAAGSGSALLQQDAAPNTSRAANEQRAVSATGQYAGNFSLSGSTNWTALVATFKQ